MKFRLTKIQGADFLLDLIAVVLGITIAFGVDQWKETRSERELELKWLRSLQSDLQETSSILMTLRERDSLQNRSMEQFMHLLDTSNAEALTVSREAYFEWSYYLNFDPQTNSFEALKSSGKTYVIQNQDLLLELFTLFIYYKKTQEGFEGYNRWFEKWVDPIFIETLSLGASNDLMHSKDEIKIENMKALQQVNRNRFQSLQHWYIGNMKGILRTYEKNEQVMNLIDKEIHRLTQ